MKWAHASRWAGDNQLKCTPPLPAKLRVLPWKMFCASDFWIPILRRGCEAPMATVHHRDSHRNLAWCPIPQ